MRAAVRSCAVLGLVFAGVVFGDDSDLVCAGEKVHAGDKFVVKSLPVDHSGWTFAIGDSAGVEFLISFGHKVTTKFPSPVPPEEFGKLTEVTIDTDTVKGVPWDMKTGRAMGPSRKIFTQSDVYQAIVTQVLGSEDGNARVCWIKFSAVPKIPKKSLRTPTPPSAAIVKK